MVLKTASNLKRIDVDGDPATVPVGRLEISPSSESVKCCRSVGVDAEQRSHLKVRIAEDLNVYHPSPSLDEASEHWYSKKELKAMRLNRSTFIKEIRSDVSSRYGVMYQSCLSKAFHECCQEQSEDYSQEIMSLGGSEQLLQAFELYPSRLGLECSTVPLVAARQRSHRLELRHFIRSVQLLHDKSTVEPRRLEECVRRTSEYYSRPSRLYAALVARVHAATLDESTERAS